MGGVLPKSNNKLSPEVNRNTRTTPRGGAGEQRPIQVAAASHNPNNNPPPSTHPRPRPERDDTFFEDIANGVMERNNHRTYHNATYGGLNLQLEVDCVDVPVQEAQIEEEESDSDSGMESAEMSDFDDGYYNAAEKVLYEKPKPKPDNTQFIVNWKKGTLLGAGGFGKVFLGLDNDTGQMFAVKEIMLGGDATGKELKGFKQEVAVMKNLHHENIVRYLGTMEDGNELNIFLEFVPGGSIAFLLSKFGSFAEPLVRRYTRQILLGLEYLHSHKIIHRDIKGANILVDNVGIVKLADFGASKQMEALMTTTGNYHSLKGTPYWMAPEVIRQSGYGRQADIWSVGCTVIEMVTGKPPFHEFTDQVSVLFHIASSNSPPPIPAHLSPTGQDFLLKCFERNPMARPNATKLLEHPFVANIDNGRKTSGGSGKFSPKPSHQSFSVPEGQLVQFARQNDDRQPSPQPQPQYSVHARNLGNNNNNNNNNNLQPLQPIQPPQQDADNLIEEPTWTWNADKRNNRFRFSSSANDIPPPSTPAHTNGPGLKRGESMAVGGHHGGGSHHAQHSHSHSHGDVSLSSSDAYSHREEVRRHKRAVSVTPEKTTPTTPSSVSFPNLPLDSNAPPTSRLSMRRHSALESTIRDPSDVPPSRASRVAVQPASSGNGTLYSSPSTPSNRLDRVNEESSNQLVSPFSNHSLATFNTSFNHSFNSINGTNITISNTPSSSQLSSSTGKGKGSPKTPRREVVDEDTINKFLTRQRDEVLQTSTKDFKQFTDSKNYDAKRSYKTIEKLPDGRKGAQLSPKKFSHDVMESISDEAPTNAKFKKKAPGTTTTTIVLNANTISGGSGSAPTTPTHPPPNIFASADSRSAVGSSFGNFSGGVTKSGTVKNAW